MNVIAVDDEPLMLYALEKAIRQSEDISTVTSFSSCEKVVEWIKNHSADIAFLDIDMRGMGGLTLAEKIQQLCPNCKIVFCTGYEKYAVEAFQLHVSGYLMKPVSAQDIQKEIDYIKEKEYSTEKKEKRLTIKCFGEFEVYVKGKIVYFHRSKSKELLAYLIDRKGASVNGREIVARLWGENENIERNLNYFRQISHDLRKTLEIAGAGDIFERNNKQYSVKTELIDCDYYTYLKTGSPEFHGEYMTQYSWAEETCGLLWKKEEHE